MKILFKSLALVTLASLPTLAFSANTVGFQGNISTSTCNITVNGNKGDATVLLPTVNVRDFVSPNSESGETPFEVAVSQCNTSAWYLPVTFALHNPRPHAASMLNMLGDGYAKGLDVIIAESPGSNMQLVQLGEGLARTSNGIIVTNGSGSLTLYVKYFRWGSPAVTPGKVRASAQYIVAYP